MLAARGSVRNRQIILDIGLRPLVLPAPDVAPVPAALELPIRQYRALVDTGAQRTCLTRTTIATEQLSSHGKRPIQNVHDTNIHYLFWINLGFWCDAEHGGFEAHKTYYALPAPVEVIDIASNYWFDALIGMDVLGRCDFNLSADGTFEIKFK